MSGENKSFLDRLEGGLIRLIRKLEEEEKQGGKPPNDSVSKKLKKTYQELKKKADQD